MRAAKFFAGMGLVRAGLERCGIETAFANNVDKTKAALYRDNWGDDVLIVGDIRDVTGDQVPTVDVATSSFPCVDLSLAGNRVGLAGERSGLVFEFCRVLGEMGDRAPRALMIENVTGFLTAIGRNDFRAVIRRLDDLGYSTETIVVNAAAFEPSESRASVHPRATRTRCGAADPSEAAPRSSVGRCRERPWRLVGREATRSALVVPISATGETIGGLQETKPSRMVRCLPADAVRACRLGDSLRRTGGCLANDTRRLFPTSHRSCGLRHSQSSMDEFAGIRTAPGSGRSTLRRCLGAAGYVRTR